MLVALCATFVWQPINAKQRVFIKQTSVATNTDTAGYASSLPTFSWEITATVNKVRQKGYQIQVASSLENVEDDFADFWDTRRVKSPLQSGIPYSGPTLQKGKTYYWRVVVTTNKGVAVSQWDTFRVDK